MADNILERLSATNIFNLQGVVAVITGGGSGIGLMISSTLIANGATVYIIGPKQEDLDRIAKIYNSAAENKAGTGRMHGIEGDVRLKSEAKRLAEEIGKREKYITVLFNNAGIQAGVFKPPASATAADYVSSLFDGVSQDDFDNVLRTNAVGPYWLTFAFLPLLEKWKNSDEPAAKKFVPQIIMTSSMNGWTKDSTTSGFSYPYQMSKSALGHATSSLAHELLPLGIRVNGIAPGLFATEMAAPGTSNELGVSHISPEIKFALEVPASPTGGTNRDMGTLALFLVANWFVNGETVLIDGGTLLKHPSAY
ncbi:NAD(P)-binding protein [Crucibulum laeve]|uniref:NAD(P)-binding protein n=1 Tax=Crucibulum laeve TaxID=68775 RepID=A0A5C3LYH0_9AGAR|nr:NAD(P)-binding protein [Crucibulum laeve]